jgi:hypothetical protein
MKTAEDELQRIRNRPRQPAPILIDVNADCQSIVINARPAEVYRRLLRIEGLPQFITSIVKIDSVTANRFSCTSIINGRKIMSEITIMMRVPDRRIAWQAVSDQFRLGVIFLDPLLGGTTKVTVKIRSIMEPLRLTGALREYLRNFKDFVERDST